MVPSRRREAVVTTVNIAGTGADGPPIESTGSGTNDQRSPSAGTPEFSTIVIPAESRVRYSAPGRDPDSVRASHPAATARRPTTTATVPPATATLPMATATLPPAKAHLPVGPAQLPAATAVLTSFTSRHPFPIPAGASPALPSTGPLRWKGRASGYTSSSVMPSYRRPSFIT